MKNELSIGIVGAGGFAAFAATAFLQVPGIKIVAITDVQPEASQKLAHTFQAKVYPEYESFLKEPNIDLVYIATPPFLHFEQSRLALLAGKHVICEKPAALETKEAEELVSLAQSRQLLYTVNLMQRYNPLFNIVKRIVDEKILGDFLHGFFENYASDEKLTPDHWFWEENKSGGIFIEHGVHFFDLFSGWLGNGQVVHAVQWQRPDVTTKIIDRVQATVVYPKGPVNFYHGFDQPKLLDRQEMRLQFERGDITLYEWVPVRMRLHGLVLHAQVEELKLSLGNCLIVEHITPSTANNKVRGRFKDIVFDRLIMLEHGSDAEKEKRYQQLLISMIQDQWSWIKNRDHIRVIDQTNAVESVRIAEQATKMSAMK
jgi:predicted dehydrogenase